MNEKLSIWESSKSLLVFYVFTNTENFQEVRNSLDLVLNDSNIKRLKVIILIQNPKEIVLKHSLFSYISENDISFFGNRIKKKSKVEMGDNLENIISSQFDLFLSFGAPTRKVMNWLTKLEAIKKIGINGNEHLFFDMNLKSCNESIDNSVIFTVNMLNKIV